MSSITVKVEGWKRIANGLSDLQQAHFLQLIAKGVGQEVKANAQKYPPRKHVSIASIGGFASDKQRRWFFWALNSGQIEVPRTRTNNLKNRWHVEARGQTGAVVGNPTPYGPFVHGDEQQSRMMDAIGWRTTSEIVDDVERWGDAQRIADKVLKRILGVLGLA